MKLEKVGFYSMLALLGGFVVRDILKAKIRVRKMAVRRSLLQLFNDDASFKTLYFNFSYDNKVLARDVVALVAHRERVEEVKNLMDDVPLEFVDQGEFFDNEINYSVYKLTKPDLKKILDKFSGIPDVVYVLFKPVPYSLDKRYLAYEIIPADKDKNPVSLQDFEVPESLPTAPLLQEDADMEGGTGTRAFAMTVSRMDTLRMNPSPPATMDLS